MRRDLTGQRFGRLEVIGMESERRSKHDIYWICRCDCGAEKAVTTGHLTSGTVSSCGCLRREQSIYRFKQAAVNNIKHGECGTSLYSVWHSMKQRCENTNNPSFKWYGAKGIKVCDEWREFDKFAEWAYANGFTDRIGAARAERLSIDRIDSSKGYNPENCRWITVHENTIRATKARWEAARSNRSGRTKDDV